ncbi:hypothetical protein ACHQM5_005493 [Ranunculus cassubicifolius]
MEDSNSNKNAGKFMEEEDDMEMVKMSISSHPLFTVLIRNHLECLKVSLGDVEISGENNYQNSTPSETTTCLTNTPELDHFMEAYCTILSELGEAMKEPLYETATFIQDMHSQLEEITKPNTSSVEES